MRYSSKSDIIIDCAVVITKSFFQYVFEKGLKILAIKKLQINTLKNVKPNPTYLPPIIQNVLSYH